MKNEVQSDNRRRNVEPAKRVDGKQQYQVDPPDNILETISLVDYDLFPSVKKQLAIGCISSIESPQAERAASGVRRLKNPFYNTMREQCDSDLIFTKKNPKKIYARSILFDWEIFELYVCDCI